MSGAETLVVLGVIANVAGIVDVSVKALRRLKNASGDIHNIPKAFRDVQSTLPLLANALKQSEQRVESGNLDEEACEGLKTALQECCSGVSELNDIFNKCLPKEGSSKFHRGWRAIMSIRQDKRVEEISELIQKRVSILTYHHVTMPTSSDIGPVSTGMAALSVGAEKRREAYSMVPVQWAEDFTGREEQMSALDSKLPQSERHVRVAIVGLGGIGKTRLVRQYVEQYKNSNISVFWIHAGTAERMRSGSRAVAKEVGIQGCDNPDVDILKKFKEWFESEESGKWLLVYDNVDDIGLMYDEQRGRFAAYLPRSNRGSIILTTRNRQMGIKFATAKNTITLPALTLAESIALLATKLGEENPGRRPDLTKLAEVLGGIPLALIQAISFIEENESTPVRYLELYEANDDSKIELLSQDFEDDTRDPELKNPIASTWIITFEYLKEHQPLAANTLCMMSMFDAQAIPEALISEIAEGDSISPTNLERTLGTLQAYSLISPRAVTGDSHDKVGRLFDLHRLVRLVTRNWLTMCSMYDHWMAEAVDLMSDKYDEIEELGIGVIQDVKSKYLPHALRLISSPPLLLQDDEEVFIPKVFHGQTLPDDHARENVICPTCTGNILRRMVDYDQSPTQVLRMTRKATAICTFALGPDHIITLGHRLNEAFCLSYLGEDVSSEIVLREVLAGYTSTFGPEHRRTLRAMHDLACLIGRQGKYSEAECLLLQLIETCTQKYGQEDELNVRSMVLLSRNMEAQGRKEDAIELISILSKLVQTVVDKFGLARSYIMTRQYSEGETLLLDLLEDKDALIRDDYLRKVWQLLAHTYQLQGLPDKAENLHRQALGYSRQLYGEHSHVTLRLLLDLGTSHYYQARYDDAEAVLLEAVERLKRHVGPDSRDVFDARWYLALTWKKQGKLDASRELALKVVNLSLKARGDQHEDNLLWVRILREIWGINPDGTEFNEQDDSDGSVSSWQTTGSDESDTAEEAPGNVLNEETV
ncbi:MAG: hypothetical protein Q9166_007244 [cf. Caloplaca sp. 2 TL-2023]